MKAPAITVIMPAYNAARFIYGAIHSVLLQTFADFELLIIDDGSTDGTGNEIARFADPRIRLLRNSQNLGLIKTLNAGLEKAEGKYVARLDADDISYPQRFEKQIDILQRDPDVGLVAGWTEIIDEHSRTRGFGNWQLSSEAIYYVLHFRQCLTHSSVMFRTSLVRELGGYSAQAIRAEDFDLWHRISRRSKIVQLPQVLVKWRDHKSSVTGTGLDEMERIAFQLAEKQLQEVTGEKWPSQIVEALVDCRSVRKLQPDLLSVFPKCLKKAQTAIIHAAGTIYDVNRLRAYADVEAAKYGYILSGMGRPFNVAVPPRARYLGFAYYLTRYHRLPVIGALMPKSHF